MKQHLNLFPQAPGVYIMKDKSGVIIYVGKAKNLQQRLKNYFGETIVDTRAQVPYLVNAVVEVETIVTASEIDAFRLEAELIRRHKPKYNVIFKDDKSRLCIQVDLSHQFPRIALVRQKDGSDHLFGPYDRLEDAKHVFDIIIRVFGLRQCTNRCFSKGKSCLLYQLHRCCGPCMGTVSVNEYAALVENATQLLQGHSKEVIALLRAKMEEASDRLEFERAHIFLQHIECIHAMKEAHSLQTTDDVIDVVGFWQTGRLYVVSILRYQGSVIVDRNAWLFDISQKTVEDDIREQLLLQYYVTGVSLPHELIATSDCNIHSVAQALQKTIRCTHPKISTKKRMLELALENASVFGVQWQQLFVRLAMWLSLKREPYCIDCFDGSHLGGKGCVVSCVRFVCGTKEPAMYRRFCMPHANGNDLVMLQEALERRYKSAKDLPDMLLIDGGKTHWIAAKKVIDQLGLDIDIVAITKDHGRHDKGLGKESLFIGKKIAYTASQEMFFLQRIRDEAHRSALHLQRKQRGYTSKL